MILASDRFKTYTRAEIAEIYVRIEILDRNENVMKSVETKAIEGSVDVDSFRDVQRAFALTLDNADNEFTWEPNGTIWLDKRVRIYVSYDRAEWISLGVFILDNPSASSSHTGERYAQLSGGDKWRLLDGSPIGKFTNITTLNAGLPVSDAIKLIATAGGVTRFLFDPCAAMIPYTLNYESGVPRGKAIKELADFANFAIYFDNNGYLRFRPKVDISKSPIVETYDKSERTLYAGSTKTLDTSDTFNKVLVVGGNNRVGPMSATAVNANPKHPLSTVNIGERLDIWRGDSAHLITTVRQAQDRADYELLKHTQFGEVQDVEIAPNYLHEADDVIRLVDDWTVTDGKYLVEKFNIPLKAGEYMRMTARKVVVL